MLVRFFASAALLLSTSTVSAFTSSQRVLDHAYTPNAPSSVLRMANADGNSVMPLPSGSLVALVTPMKSDGSVDADGLRELLRWHKAEGTNGIVILGTTGEASTLTSEEKVEVMTITREEVGGVLPIVVGTGTIDTQQSIAATRQAKANGADVVRRRSY